MGNGTDRTVLRERTEKETEGAVLSDLPSY